MFLLLYKCSCSHSPVCGDVGPQRIEHGCALLMGPQPGRTVQVSVRPLASSGTPEEQELGVQALLLVAVVLSRSLEVDK